VKTSKEEEEKVNTNITHVIHTRLHCFGGRKTTALTNDFISISMQNFDTDSVFCQHKPHHMVDVHL
jgi:hypothetical protein